MLAAMTAGHRSEPGGRTLSLGLITVSVGLLGAVALIPGEYGVPGALRPSGLAMAAGILAPVAAAFRRRPMDVFRAENLLLLSIVYFILLDLIQGKKEPQEVSPDSVRLAFLAIGLFAGGVCYATLSPPWPLPTALRTAFELDIDSHTLFRAAVACTCLCMTHYVVSCNFDPILLVESLGRDRFSAPWTGTRLGNWRAFQEHLVYFGYLVPTLTVLLSQRIGWHSSRTIVAAGGGGLVVLFATQSGARGEIGIMIGAAILTWLLLQKSLTWTVQVRLVLATAALLAWMQVMFIVRNEGLAVLFSPDRERVTEELAEGQVQVDDNFNRLCQVMDLIPERVAHTHGGQLFYVAVRPIPRALWPGKPVGPGFSFEMEVVGDESATWSVTSMGELYYDFGLPFVLLGGYFLGRLAVMWDELLERRRGVAWPMLYGLGALALVAGVRSQQAFILRTYPILFWFAISRVAFRTESAHSQPVSHSAGVARRWFGRSR